MDRRPTRRPVNQDLQHRRMALLHHTQHHQHDGLLDIDDIEQAEPNRPLVSHSYRSHRRTAAGAAVVDRLTFNAHILTTGTDPLNPS